MTAPGEATTEAPETAQTEAIDISSLLEAGAGATVQEDFLPPESPEAQQPDSGPVYESPAGSTGRRGRKKALGPDDQPELAELFTEDGIGQIVTDGLQAFFRSCGAEPMQQKQENSMRRIVAYYCRVRLPVDAGKYQPELLLISCLASAIIPRIGPIATKTSPFWARMKEKVVGIFKRKAE